MRRLGQVYKNGNMANESEESEERDEPILFCREANLCGTSGGIVLCAT